MTRTNFISRLTTMSRRRWIATSVIYGLSLSVRFTSAAGEEVELPTQYASRVHPLASIMASDSSRLPYHDWRHKPVLPIVLRQGWPPASPTPGCIVP
jgi:hypothetical protein